MRKLLFFLICVGSVWTTLNVNRPGEAQILTVTGEYRVTELDQKNMRFGVAMVEARPDVTQNWVYIDPNTEIHQRVSRRDGWSKEQRLNFYQFFDSIKPGVIARVHGGRRWDGEISGKKLWVGYPVAKE